jgi:hypothetical protein
MEYRDFTIDVRSAEGGGFEAAVVEAPMRDNPRVRFAEPLTRDALQGVLDAFEVDAAALASSPVCPHEIGKQLSAALFADGLAELFQRCGDAVCRDGRIGLRLRLRFRTDDPQAGYLAALPWEWLLDPRSGEFLATDIGTPVVRELAVDRPRPFLEVEPPLRILVVDAAPRTLNRLNLKLETARMTEALQELIEAGQVEILQLVKNTPDHLRDALLDEGIHVLHFMGHGGYDPDSGAGAISFVKDDGSEDQVDGEMLAAFLKRTPSLRLVVLNACKTARHAGRLGGPFNHGVASAILERAGVPAVVANQHSISNDAAVVLSATFYRRIAAGAGVDEAITEARLRAWPRTVEWATPVLFLTAPGGKILAVKPAQGPTAVRRPGAKAEDGPVRLGVRSIDGWGRDMEQRNDRLLDLVSYFDGRFIKDKSWWQDKVFPELREFLLGWLDQRRPLLLDFAAHSSIAFAAGWLLEPKSGLDVRVRQRTGNVGEFEWHPLDGSDSEGASAAGAPLWRELANVHLAPGAPDVAVALSVSQPAVADHVLEFIRQQGLPVGRILDATIAPEPGQHSVRGGAHALRLAQALLPSVQVRQPHERRGRVHFFCAGPNALVFYLGQLASSLGRIVLYEYPFRAGDSFGRYQQSIELPPPGEMPQIPQGW